MKRKIVTLLFVCCLGISVAACGNETTDTKEYGEASDNELTIDEDDSEDEDYAETLGNSSSVSSSTSSTSRSALVWYNILHYSVISPTIKQNPTLSRIPHIKSSYCTTAPFSFTRIFPVSTRQPDITICSISSHYLAQLTPGTRSTTHQITARYNKKAHRTI